MASVDPCFLIDITDIDIGLVISQFLLFYLFTFLPFLYKALQRPHQFVGHCGCKDTHYSLTKL